MKKRQQASIAGFVLGFILLLIIGGIAFVFNSSMFEKDPPQVNLPKEIDWNLKDPLKVQVSDASGLRFVKATLFDGEKSVTLESKELKKFENNVDLNITFPKTGFGANKKTFELTIDATDSSKWNFFAGNSIHVKSLVKVDTKRPDVNIIGSSYKIMKGGVASVVFKAYDEGMKSLYIETNFGKKFYPTPFIKMAIIFLWLHGQRILIILVHLLLPLIKQVT